MPKSLYEVVSTALKDYRTFEEGKPEIISTGMEAVDNDIGGMMPGECGILAADTGVGKSSIVLLSAMQRKGKTGYITLEDPERSVGSRAVASVAGVDSRDIRKKNLSDTEIQALRKAHEELKASQVYVEACLPSLPAILESLDALAQVGCKLVWIDYIQKIRGKGSNPVFEIASYFTKVGEWAKENGVAIMWVSQFHRRKNESGQSMRHERPNRSNIKGSGDLENESRLVVLCWQDDVYSDRIRAVLEKNSYGREGIEWSYERTAYGSLVAV